MSLPRTSPQSTDVAALAGVTVIGRIRRLLIISGIAALVYSEFMASSRGHCPGGFDGNGGFIDEAGRPVDEALPCIHLTLEPSPLVFIGIAVIVLLAIGRVMKAADDPAALRTLTRATVAVSVLVVVAVLVSQVWFFTVSIEGFNSGSWSIFSPFPFGLIEVEITPMAGS